MCHAADTHGCPFSLWTETKHELSEGRVEEDAVSREYKNMSE